jgi:hypothetical protein
VAELFAVPADSQRDVRIHHRGHHVPLAAAIVGAFDFVWSFLTDLLQAQGMSRVADQRK